MTKPAVIVLLLTGALAACPGSTPGVDGGTGGTSTTGSAASGTSSAGTTGTSAGGGSTGTGGAGSTGGGSSSGGSTGASDAGFGQIQHVFIIFQENRSFDSYFGTFKGADGIPRFSDGGFASASARRLDDGCVRLYHDRSTSTRRASRLRRRDRRHRRRRHEWLRGPTAESGRRLQSERSVVLRPTASASPDHDVMGFHDDREIPNYWSYARAYVLQDHIYQSNASWSLPSHLFMVSEWSARLHLARRGPVRRREACVSNIDLDLDTAERRRLPNLAWTDLTYLLHKAGVTWKNYLVAGHRARLRRWRDDVRSGRTAAPRRRASGTPLPSFDTVKADGELGNVVDFNQFYKDVEGRHLPSGLVVLPVRRGQRAPAGLDLDGPGLRDRHRQRDHGGARTLGDQRRSLSAGTTGVASTITSTRRSST